MTNYELAQYTLSSVTLGIAISVLIVAWRRGILSLQPTRNRLSRLVIDGDREAIAEFLRKH